MKKRHGLDRALPVIARHELDALPTGALLARLKRLRWCELDPQRSDLDSAEIASASHLILFKSDANWRSAYDDLKQILSSREHVRNEPRR